MNLLARTRLWQKILIIAIAVLIPGLIAQYRMTNEHNGIIATAHLELRGAAYSQGIEEIIEPLSNAAFAASMVLGGNAQFNEPLNRALAQLGEGTADLEKLDQSHGAALNSTTQWQPLKKQLQTLQSSGSSISNETLAVYDDTLTKLQQLNNHVVSTSGLILDPEATTYFLMDYATTTIPNLEIAMGQLFNSALAFSKQPRPSYALRNNLSAGVHNVASTLQHMEDVQSQVSDSDASWGKRRKQA